MTISELLREEFRRQKQEEERRKQEEERRNRWGQEDESARLKRDEELFNPLDFDGEIGVFTKEDKFRQDEPFQIEAENLNDDSKGKRERQVDMIIMVAHELGYDPLRVPRGGKINLMKTCIERDGNLFTESGFEHAWKSTNRLKVENLDKYKSK